MRRGIWFNACLAGALLALPGCGQEAVRPAFSETPLLDRMALQIAASAPRVVIANENHDEPRSRYVSACILEAVSRQMEFDFVGAETFAGSGALEPGPDLSERLSGAYLRRAHFVDIVHAAGPDRPLLAYDERDEIDQLSADELRGRGLSPYHWNGRERNSAENIASVLGRENGASAFIHVGHGHGRKLWHHSPHGDHARLGGHLVALGMVPLVSVSTIYPPPAFRGPCPERIDLMAMALVADLEAGTLECASKENPPDGPIGYDVFILDNFPPVDEAGYITETISGCTLRRPVLVAVPEAARFADEVKLTVFQHDSYGRRAGTWSGSWRSDMDLELAAMILDTGSAQLAWSWPDGSGRRVWHTETIDW